MKIKTSEFLGIDYYEETICHTQIIHTDIDNLWAPPVEGEALHYGLTDTAALKCTGQLKPLVERFKKPKSLRPTISLVYDHTDPIDHNYAIIEFDFESYPNSNYFRKEAIKIIRQCSNADPLHTTIVDDTHHRFRTWQNP